MAGGAGDAARDHAPAAVVPVPLVESVVLVTHGDCAAAGADGAQANGPQSARRHGPGAVPHPAGTGARLDPRALSFGNVGTVFQAGRCCPAGGPASIPSPKPA